MSKRNKLNSKHIRNAVEAPSEKKKKHIAINTTLAKEHKCEAAVAAPTIHSLDLSKYCQLYCFFHKDLQTLLIMNEEDNMDCLPAFHDQEMAEYYAKIYPD